MIVVGHCEVCGAEILGSPYNGDAMSGVCFMTCECADNSYSSYENYDDPDDHIIGSGDFDTNTYGGGY